MSDSRSRPFAIFSIVAAAIGWYASFMLATEYLHVLKDPNYSPGCNISVLVSCGPNMGSPQGSVLGFSNTFIGITAFAAPIIVGMSILAGARFARWYWALYNVGLLGGYALITYLWTQSVYASNLHTLCPWCMVIWTVMIPLFWFGTADNLRSGVFGDRLRSFGRVFYSWAWVVVVLNYLVIALCAQLELNWAAELMRALS